MQICYSEALSYQNWKVVFLSTCCRFQKLYLTRTVRLLLHLLLEIWWDVIMSPTKWFYLSCLKYQSLVLGFVLNAARWESNHMASQSRNIMTQFCCNILEWLTKRCISSIRLVFFHINASERPVWNRDWIVCRQESKLSQQVAILRQVFIIHPPSHTVPWGFIPIVMVVGHLKIHMD